jgi:hypothetical protein
LTEPEHRYIFFYKSDSTEHHQVYFPNKNEIVGLFSTVVRSIENKKDIIYRSDLTEYTIINITSNISKVRVGNQIFSIDLSSTNDILKQFSQTKPVFHPKKNIKLVKANIQLKNQIKNK